jgi:lipoate-protein ligase B
VGVIFNMTEELTTQSYCEVCGIDVNHDTDLKRFGKRFCSEAHMDQYVKAKQQRLGYEEENEQKREMKKGDGWRSLLRSCC